MHAVKEGDVPPATDPRSPGEAFPTTTRGRAAWLAGELRAAVLLVPGPPFAYCVREEDATEWERENGTRHAPGEVEDDATS